MHISKFPHYHQQESADCGPACLRMIAKYYGRQYSLEMLREHSFISREVTALTYMPNGQGECAMKCHSSTLLPWNILFGANQNVELLVENKTIFETFFKNKFFN